jgi:SAM-dependent methyltransferase
MKTIQRPWDWWAYHFRVIHRSQIPDIGQWDDDLVALVVAVLGLEPGNRILDLACGSGVHALRMAVRGFDVVGIDIAPSLVAHCRQQADLEGIESAQFLVGDMRELNSESQFDAILLLSGSFGFFDDAVNQDVLARVARALKPGGRLLVDVFDPGEMMVRPARRSWIAYGGGFGLNNTWWEPETCTYVNEFAFIDSEGILNTSAERERIRVYSVPEWKKMFTLAGLQLDEALADSALPPVAYDRDHYGNLVLVASKRG